MGSIMQNYNFDLFLAKLPSEMVPSDPLLPAKSLNKLFERFLNLLIVRLKSIISV